MDAIAGLAIQITGYENINKSYTEYIVVCAQGVSRWEVRKRYSEFQQLHTDLKARGRVDAQLPPKKLFGKLSDAVISKRQDGLNDYLLRVHRAASPEQRGVLGSFLRVPQAVRQAPGVQGEQAVVFDGVRDASSNDGDGRKEMVEQVADRMIDAFQAPVPVKGRDAKTRQAQYRKILQGIVWSQRGDALHEHLQASLCALPRPPEGVARGGCDGSPTPQGVEEARRRLGQAALSAQDDAMLGAALKQLTAATKAVQVGNKDPFVVFLGELTAADEAGA